MSSLVVKCLAQTKCFDARQCQSDFRCTVLKSKRLVDLNNSEMLSYVERCSTWRFIFHFPEIHRLLSQNHNQKICSSNKFKDVSLLQNYLEQRKGSSKVHQKSAKQDIVVLLPVVPSYLLEFYRKVVLMVRKTRTQASEEDKLKFGRSERS